MPDKNKPESGTDEWYAQRAKKRKLRRIKTKVASWNNYIKDLNKNKISRGTDSIGKDIRSIKNIVKEMPKIKMRKLEEVYDALVYFGESIMFDDEPSGWQNAKKAASIGAGLGVIGGAGYSGSRMYKGLKSKYGNSKEGLLKSTKKRFSRISKQGGNIGEKATKVKGFLGELWKRGGEVVKKIK